MLVDKCSKLRRINLITGEKTMRESLRELTISLRSYAVELNIDLREFHDREIRFFFTCLIIAKKNSVVK